MKEALPVRWIDAGELNSWRSQAIYHALAYARTPHTPDTVVWVRPSEPYACIGFHQDVEQELDLETCRSCSLPVIRRETGGGTVFIDRQQLFIQWVFAPEHLPLRLDQRFQLFIAPLVETHRSLGLDAYLHPPNDVHVRGRKIGGTGAGTIGQAEVMTANFLLDFDYAAMVRLLKVPDADFRRLFSQGLQQYLTTLRRELGQAPDEQTLQTLYRGHCERILRRPLEPGSLTPEEEAWIERIEQRFASEEWLFHHRKRPPAKPSRLVKVHADLWVGQVVWEGFSGRELRLTLLLKGKRIQQVHFGKGFQLSPSYRVDGLQRALRNMPLEEESLLQMIQAFFQLHNVSSSELDPTTLTQALMRLSTLNPMAPFAAS